MAIPDLFEIRGPTLAFLAEQPERHVNVKQELVPAVAKQFDLTEEKNLRYGRSEVEVFPDYVALACSTLSQAGLIEETKYGCVRITQAGQDYVNGPYEKLNEINPIKNPVAYRKWKAARREFMLKEGKLASSRPAHRKWKAGVG